MFFLLLTRPPPRPTLFPYTTLFRSEFRGNTSTAVNEIIGTVTTSSNFSSTIITVNQGQATTLSANQRSEEHTSELQSHSDLVCRLLLEKKKCTLLSMTQSGATANAQ